MSGVRGASPEMPGVQHAHRLRNVLRIVWSGVALVLYPLGKVIPRNDRLWVFGKARSFTDNSRYLMEYVVRHHPEIRAVWLARDPASRDRAREQGFEAHLVTSMRGISIAFRARVGVVCEGLSDLNRAALAGMTITNLYHGTAFKKIGLDSPVTWTVVGGPLGKWINRFTRFLYRMWMRQIDVLPAPSRTVAAHLKSAFDLPPHRIPVAGCPRTDIILGSLQAGCEAGAELKTRLGLPQSSKLVLYAPTWREYANAGALVRGFDSTEWSRVLAENDAYLLVRLHPNMQLDERDRARLMGDRLVHPGPHDWADINRLLCAIDILITDYSSIVFDFALLKRPVLFVAPDYDAFASARNFYEPYDRLTEGRHLREWDEACRAMEACLTGRGEAYLATATNIHARYNAFHDTKNCERIVDAILDATAGGRSAHAARPLRDERRPAESASVSE